MKKTTTAIVIALAGLLHSNAPAADIALSAGPGGITLQGTAIGKLTLPAPKLLVEDGSPKGEEGIMEVKDDKTLTVKFEKAAATITINAQDLSLTYALDPQVGVKSLRVLMVIPLTFAEGGKFAFGGAALKPLPSTPGEQFLGQTGTTSFTLVNSAGAGIRLDTPDTFQELADTRVFNMPRFVYAVFLKAGTNDNKWTLKFGPAAP
jgi:hypothetical protein